MAERVTVAALGAKVDALVSAVSLDREQHTTQHEQICSELHAIARTLRGSNGDPGMVGRVTSLEDDRRRRDRHIYAIWSIIVASVGAYVRTRILGH